MRLHGEADVLLGSKVKEQAVFLERARQSKSEHPLGRKTRHLTLRERDAARRGRQLAGNNVEERGLARSIWTDNGSSFARVHREGDVLKDFEAGEVLADAIEAKQPHASSALAPSSRYPRCRRARTA